MQQRLKENEDALSSQKSECSDVKQKEEVAYKELAELKKRVKELSGRLVEKEAELNALQENVHEQSQQEYCIQKEQDKIKLNIHTQIISFDLTDHPYFGRELQKQLELQAEVEKQLHALVEQKERMQSTLEQKIGRLEDQLEQHRQVMIVRGERINTLDTELKQRESESNRKINDLMTLTNDKTAIITQVRLTLYALCALSLPHTRSLSSADNQRVGLDERTVPESMHDAQHQAVEAAQPGACDQAAGGEQCAQREAAHEAGREERAAQGRTGSSKAHSVSRTNKIEVEVERERGRVENSQQVR